ncbi:MAG: FmdB family transcriptional regulator [Anaerolineae bacterium]|nr:MAG: FmdB family transcriptional regulator [Anaerolineae bacterium]
MPRYDFSCQICGSVFERSIPFGGSTAEVTCPNGHRNVRRLYSAPAVVFKGSGFYITDNRKGEKPSNNEAN